MYLRMVYHVSLSITRKRHVNVDTLYNNVTTAHSVAGIKILIFVNRDARKIKFYFDILSGRWRVDKHNFPDRFAACRQSTFH